MILIGEKLIGGDNALPHPPPPTPEKDYIYQSFGQADRVLGKSIPW